MLRSIGILMIVACIASSCRHNSSCVLAVYCCDSLANPRQNVSVKLYRYVTGLEISESTQPEMSGVSNSTGYVYFSRKLPGLYTVHASDGTTSGSAIIESYEGHLASQRVIMK